ncbi:MAG TPA: bifunctional serine/threonine-protein kinase/ABC transporter substrate-binding protein, partial [Polyangiaceae bacterium]
MKAGDQIDRYTILAPLGRGGMGDVYKAHDRRLHRNVALKVLRVDPEDEVPRAEVVARMFREARAAAALEHPNVVVIHDVGEVTLEGEAEPTCFIAMELIEGDVLRNFIGRTDVSVEEKVRWLLDVARALAFAHERGIVHRDVKPDNVILRDDGVVKVLDFGIARRAHGVDKGATGGGALPTLTGKGLTLGTPKYMSPEQMLNEDLDGRADQYAWGVVAYELLSGRSPWSGSTDSLQFVAEVLTRQPEPLSSRAPRVPKDVADVVERAMAKKKDERFPTMLELIAALDGSRPPIASLRKMTPARPTAPEDATLRAQQSTRPNPAATLGSPVEPRRIGAAKIAAAAGTLGLVAVLAFVSFRSREVAPVPSAHVQGRACASNAACSTKLGAPALCRARDGTCVQLASEDCRVAAEPSDLENPATIWVGAMFPLTGEDAASFGDREFQAVDLARADFAHLMAGANARPGGARPLAVLACDDARDQARAARHLVTDVEVPAIIGFRSSNEAIELATSTLIPKGILGVAALNTSPMITSLPRMPGEPRMIWRTTYSGAEAALPISLVVPDVIEGEVRKTLGRSEPLRVALVRQDDAAGLGFADIL